MVEWPLMAEMTADEIKIGIDHLRLSSVIDSFESSPHKIVETVVEDNHGPPGRVGRKQVAEVTLGAIGAVIAIDEREVDIYTFGR